MIHIRWMSSVETSYSMGTMNKDDILRLTDRGMAIFKHYLPTPFRVGRNFLNPLYEDKHASCNIYYERRSDTYKMKDFGNDDYSGDCFAFVGKLNGLDCKDSKDFIQIMKIIDRDLHLGLSSGNYIETKTITPISPAVTAATSPSKVKKARPYTLAQKSFTYNPQIQISAESETKRSIFREKDKTKRSKKESAQHSKSRNKSFVMTSVSAL